MSKLKELWVRWKVQISFVAGALVVATAYGQCTFVPALPGLGDDVEESSEEASEEAATEEASTETTETTETTGTTETTETTGTTESDESSE